MLLSSSLSPSRPRSGRWYRAQRPFLALLTDPWVLSAGEGWAVAASVEEAEGDHVVGGLEPVGEAGEQPEFGVHALGESV